MSNVHDGMEPGFDVRYERFVCATCGREHQSMDWNGAAHVATCGKDANVRMRLSGDEAYECVVGMVPGMRPMSFPLVTNDGPRTCEIAPSLAAMIASRRQGVEVRVS